MSVIVSTFLIFSGLLISFTCGCVFSAVLSNLCQKNNNGRLTLKIVTIMKVHNTNLTILFIDFHRLPLSINKNHLIATDFYHYSGQNTKQVTQDTSKYLSNHRKSHLSMSMETLKNSSFIHFLINNRSLHNLFDAIIVQN